MVLPLLTVTPQERGVMGPLRSVDALAVFPSHAPTALRRSMDSDRKLSVRQGADIEQEIRIVTCIANEQLNQLSRFISPHSGSVWGRLPDYWGRNSMGMHFVSMLGPSTTKLPDGCPTCPSARNISKVSDLLSPGSKSKKLSLNSTR
jgi:hypothetical protein